ncbi:MAG: protein-glutamate O-methyltransferase CheR [Desulfobulbaceae bacterium]|nr:protein-glutamate O-methyltransferase CheR [Desulfobulbaceae bacterium]
MQKITVEEIKVLGEYIHGISGIVLDHSKGYLIESRLRPLLSETGCKTFSDLFYKTRSDSSGRLKYKIIDAISTNETFFFRDSTPFELLRNKILPELIDRRRQQYKPSPLPLRIWSAACSSGQEVYSIAMTLKEMLPDLRSYNITILGSDISDTVIAQASYGKYSKFEVNRGLSKHYLHKYFNQVGSEWRIKDEIRAMTQFDKINLLKPFPEVGKFDIIFCRNVAIYFSPSDRSKLFQKFAHVLEDDGALLLGGSESLSGMNLPFESNNYLRGIYYQKKGWNADTHNTPSSAEQKTLPRPASPIVHKVTPGTKPVIVRNQPVQIKEAIPKSKPASTPSQSSSKASTFPSAPTTPQVERETQAGKTLTAKQEKPPKKSLLSALQETKRTEKNRLIDKQTTDGTSTGKKSRGSLLATLAARKKKKEKDT